jgi:hypothetical protein
MKNNSTQIRNEHEEYQQIRKDLIFVVLLNILFFATLLGLFFYNQSTGQLDQFFAKYLKF